MRFSNHAVISIIVALLGAMLASCSKDPEALAQPIAPQDIAIREGARAGCPMALQGAQIAVSDTQDGVTLAWTTSNSNVADLRTRVRYMAQMYATHQGHGAMMWHRMHGEGMGHGQGRGEVRRAQMESGDPMPAASSTVTDTDNGASIEFRPSDPLQLQALREHVRSHQQRMHAGECWTVQE